MNKKISIQTLWLNSKISKLQDTLNMWQQLDKVLEKYRSSHLPFSVNTIGEAIFGEKYCEETPKGVYTANAIALHNQLGQALYYLCWNKEISIYTPLASPRSHRNYGPIIYYIP